MGNGAGSVPACALSNDLAIGYDAGRPVVMHKPGTEQPPPAHVIGLINQRREALIRELTVLTSWLMASEEQNRSPLVVPPAGFRVPRS